MDRRLAWLVLLFGALVAAGGVLGGLRAGSAGSVVSGSLLGAGLLLSGAFGLRRSRRASAVALALCALTAGVMAYRLHASRSLVPALPVGVLAVALVYALAADLKRQFRAGR